MEKLKRLSIIVAVAGALVGALGYGWASLSDSGRIVGTWMFVGGFLALCLGVLSSVLFTPNARFGDLSPWGIKLMAIGFAFAVVSSVLGGLLDPRARWSNDLFWFGSVSMFVGVVVHAVSMLKGFFRKRSGALAGTDGTDSKDAKGR